MTASPARVTLASNTVLVPAKDILCQDVGDETILLNTDSELYYVLNPTGRVAWGLLDGTRELHQIISSLLETYPAVPPGELESDFRELASQLLEAGLASVDA